MKSIVKNKFANHSLLGGFTSAQSSFKLLNFTFIFNLIFFSLLSLGQLQRISLNNQLSFYLIDLVIILYLAWKLISKQLLWPQFKKWSKSSQYFFAWLLIATTFHCFFSPKNILFTFLYSGRWLAYFLFVFNFVQNQKNQSTNLIYYLLGSGILFAFWGLLQYFLLPDLRFLKVLGWDDHYYRLTSTQLDPNFAGLIIIFTFASLKLTALKLNQSLVKLLEILLLLALALTFSRASFLSFLVFILSLELSRAKFNLKLKPSYPAFILLSLFILLSQILLKQFNIGGEGVKLNRTSSIDARLTDSQQNFEQLKTQEYLLGQGLITSRQLNSNSQFENHAKFPSNLLVLIFQTGGLIGLILFLFFLKDFSQKIYQHKIIFLPILLATLTHSMFNHSLLQNFIFLWVNLLWYMLPQNRLNKELSKK